MKTVRSRKFDAITPEPWHLVGRRICWLGTDFDGIEEPFPVMLQSGMVCSIVLHEGHVHLSCDRTPGVLHQFDHGLTIPEQWEFFPYSES